MESQPKFYLDKFGLMSRADALLAGFTDRDLATACRDGQLIKVARGTFAEARDMTPEERHRLTVIATMRSIEPPRVVSHESAAVLHGLAMLKPDLARVHYLSGSPSGARIAATRYSHAGGALPSDTDRVDGLMVTAMERTAVDVACATTMGFAGALTVFDAALRKRADRDRMAAELDVGRRRGVAAARRALACAAGGAESPGESWSRAQMIEARLPVPRLQQKFFDQGGQFVAQTDFDWDARLVAEFDGMVKYQKLLLPGESAFDAMRREKEREDALRAMGVMVIRLVWRDLERRQVASKIRYWLDRTSQL